MQLRRKYLTKDTWATDPVLVLTFWQMYCQLEIVGRLICLGGGGTREMSCLAAGWKKTPVLGTLCPQLHIWSIFFGGPRFANYIYLNTAGRGQAMIYKSKTCEIFIFFNCMFV